MKNKVIEWIYINNGTDTVRYALGEKGNQMVACIGINPSTARPDSLDNTLKSVKRIANFNGFDGWAMYNVYPLRATDPKNLPQEIDHALRLNNLEILRKSIKGLGIKTIWIAYGDLIESRNYLRYCMAELYLELSDLGLKWKIIQDPTQKGHPRHPLYKKAQSKFEDFDFDDYHNEKLKPFAEGFERK